MNVQEKKSFFFLSGTSINLFFHKSLHTEYRKVQFKNKKSGKELPSPTEETSEIHLISQG